MISLNYVTLRSNSFRMALSKVVQCDALDSTTAYRVMRLSKLMEQKIADTQKDWVKLAKELAQSNEDGSFKIDEVTKELLWKDGVESESALQQFRDFNQKEVVFDRLKFPLASLNGAKLSPADLAILEPLLEDPEEQAEQPT